MPELPDELLQQLLDLIDELRHTTGGFVDQPGDQQTWYNRGYANGMLLALQALVPADRLGDRRLDEPAQLGAHVAMPWGKAFRHGETVGRRETYEITGTQPS